MKKTAEEIIYEVMAKQAAISIGMVLSQGGTFEDAVKIIMAIIEKVKEDCYMPKMPEPSPIRIIKENGREDNPFKTDEIQRLISGETQQ